MLNTHFSHFVALHLNFFIAATYDFCEHINAMCGTRETLDMGILRQHSLPLAEARALCISIAFSTQIHSIVCMPTSGSVFSMHPLLQARSSYHIASWRVLWSVLPKKWVLFGPRDVDCDSAHAVRTLSLPLVAFEMLVSM
jgi:hypothetical protein